MASINFRRLSLGDALRIGIPLLLVVGLAFWVTSRFVKPAPPDSLVLATGAKGGAYERYARLYQAFFARNGVRLELKPSEGAVENLARITDGSADAGFVQGGIATPPAEDDTPTVVSLGALYYEPLWIFARAAATGEVKTAERLRDLSGKRIAIGADGSGTQSLARLLLDTVGADTRATTLLPLGGEQAAAALANGDVDGAILVSGVSAPVIGALVRRRDVEVVNLAHSQAIARQHGFLSPLSIPRGLVDIRADLPDHEVSTVAVTANLLVRPDLHPALMYLFLDAATQIHGRQSLLADAGTFPNGARQDVPLSDEAERFYKSGKPLLQRYLPFWVANLVDRMLVYLIPLVAVLVPALRFLPDLLAYKPRLRIARLYGRLRALESEMAAARDASQVSTFVARLDEIESDVTRTKLPVGYSHDVYALRAAIDLVRERVGRPGAKAIPTFRGTT